MSKWVRARFRADYDDPRPVRWPPPGPFWESGFAADGSYAIVVAYVRKVEQVREFWPEADHIETEPVAAITFSDRFPEPEWWEKETNG